jgi:hypothetical protein
MQSTFLAGSKHTRDAAETADADRRPTKFTPAAAAAASSDSTMARLPRQTAANMPVIVHRKVAEFLGGIATLYALSSAETIFKQRYCSSVYHNARFAPDEITTFRRVSRTICKDLVGYATVGPGVYRATFERACEWLGRHGQERISADFDGRMLRYSFPTLTTMVNETNLFVPASSCKCLCYALCDRSCCVVCVRGVNS